MIVLMIVPKGGTAGLYAFSVGENPQFLYCYLFFVMLCGANCFYV